MNMGISEQHKIVSLQSSHASAFIMRHISYMVREGFVLLLVLGRDW